MFISTAPAMPSPVVDCPPDEACAGLLGGPVVLPLTVAVGVPSFTSVPATVNAHSSPSLLAWTLRSVLTLLPPALPR